MQSVVKGVASVLSHTTHLLIEEAVIMVKGLKAPSKMYRVARRLADWNSLFNSLGLT
jgi:hypothetical protein